MVNRETGFASPLYLWEVASGLDSRWGRSQGWGWAKGLSKSFSIFHEVGVFCDSAFSSGQVNRVAVMIRTAEAQATQLGPR